MTKSCCRYRPPLHAVRAGDVTTSFQGIFMPREVDFLLKDVWSPSRVTKSVWKTPVAASLEAHERSESGILPLCAELGAKGNMFKTVKVAKQTLSACCS